ncbi:hypothetical protein ABZ281_39780 [Streptomyces sp. NPDC006265]
MTPVEKADQTGAMLHLRLITPSDRTDEVVRLIEKRSAPPASSC